MTTVFHPIRLVILFYSNDFVWCPSRLVVSVLKFPLFLRIFDFSSHFWHIQFYFTFVLHTGLVSFFINSIFSEGVNGSLSRGCVRQRRAHYYQDFSWSPWWKESTSDWNHSLGLFVHHMFMVQLEYCHLLFIFFLRRRIIPCNLVSVFRLCHTLLFL